MIANSNLNLPWMVAALEGKYYGTVIKDSKGHDVMTVWGRGFGPAPSARQLDDWSGGGERVLTDADFDELMCDSHYERMEDYEVAAYVVEAVNSHTPACKP